MTQTYRKKLIEVALPLDAINEASAKEKANPFLKNHPRRLHLWWARRPLTASRAVIFASLVDDPDAPDAPTDFVKACKKLPRGKNAAENDTPRQRLFDFIEQLVTWEATNDENILKKARELINLSTDGNPPPLLDPFAGGGSIPLEAQRLGLEAHASDLNPVAVMINKAQIEIPPKFANLPPVNPRDNVSTALGSSWKGTAGLAADVRYYGEWIQNKSYEQIGHLYPKLDGEVVIAWLWARTVKCPNPACGTNIPLIRSLKLSTKKGKSVWLEPKTNLAGQQIQFAIKHKKPSGGDKGTVSRSGAQCLACGTPVALDYIRSEGKAKKIGTQLLAIVTESRGGPKYHPATEEHTKIADIAAPIDTLSTSLPQHALGFRVQLYGITSHKELFTPRQITTLTTYIDLISNAHKKIYEDATSAGILANDNIPLTDGGQGIQAYADAVVVYLMFAISRWSDYLSSLCKWNAINQNIAHVFGMQTLSYVWDFAEANIFGSKLSFETPVEWVTSVLDSFQTPEIAGVVSQGSATELKKYKKVMISTDPPYYDNVGYADLSDFFYVWLRLYLQKIYPNIFSTLLTPKENELVVNYHKFKDRESANAFFESGLEKVFSRFIEIGAHEYPTSIYYAFKQEETDNNTNEQLTSNTGWETMLEGLINAGFSIVGTWPMRTERQGRLRETSSNALASSVVLVCRPRFHDASITSRREFINTLRSELPIALRNMQTGNIAPVDLAQASIGPGMAVYSRYSKVLEPDGSPLTVRAALQIINHELDSYLAELEGEMDSDSRFATSWFEQFGFKEGGFGQADVLARAKNTSVEGLAQAGVLKSEAGKVSLLHWSGLAQDWDPEKDKRLTVWEITHHLIERLNNSGETGVARLLAKLSPDHAADARQMAYRLYSICERKGWAEHARDYNALVVSWGTSQEQAREYKEDKYQQEHLL